ncbi:EF-hand domain-containing member C2 [Thoreauomyces humboldtii]|nr:EF-hand domain-containing member C2 [Thoreauomyces humboldtii]
MRGDVAQELQHKLPFLPGYQFDLNKSRFNERKSHAFDYTNGVAVHKPAPGIGGKSLPGQDEAKIHTSLDLYPHGNNAADGVPAWVAFDRKVLRFYAYFQEAVHERREEQYRVRKVNIYFYLEDDSVHVSEPKTANSGIPQGTLIRRHRITKPESANGQHYTVADFNVGKEVTFYSRTFKIVGCDDFTKDFLSTLHVAVPSNGGFPTDPYSVHRAELASRMKATRPRPPQTSLKKFLENDRRVLRFYCAWDDTQSVFGDLRHMIVHYYLSDDTIEIREHIPANAGRDANTLFLRRSKLPKRMPVWLYGHNNAEDKNAGEYFNERDFMIGAVLHLYGRPFVVCDCDDFTKEYYNGKYGVETFDPVRIEDYETPASPPPFSQSALAANYELLLPPSPLTPANAAAAAAAAALNTTIPMIGAAAPPKKDFSKLMLYDTTTLRFSAALHSTRQVDKDRRFVVSLYVADDTVSVFEPKSRNTGLVGGKFLEKSRIRKPDGIGYYGTKDFYIGAELVFFHHPFILTAADDYAVKFMAEHPDMFPGSQQEQTAAGVVTGATAPVPAPVLAQWQEDVLQRGEPLPFAQPGTEFAASASVPASRVTFADAPIPSDNSQQQFQLSGLNGTGNGFGRSEIDSAQQQSTARWNSEPSTAAANVLARLRGDGTILAEETGNSSFNDNSNNPFQQNQQQQQLGQQQFQFANRADSPSYVTTNPQQQQQQFTQQLQQQQQQQQYQFVTRADSPSYVTSTTTPQQQQQQQSRTASTLQQKRPGSVSTGNGATDGNTVRFQQPGQQQQPQHQSNQRAQQQQQRPRSRGGNVGGNNAVANEAKQGYAPATRPRANVQVRFAEPGQIKGAQQPNLPALPSRQLV